MRWTCPTSGTATAPITFEAAPGQTPVIDSSGGWNAINIEASYIVTVKWLYGRWRCSQLHLAVGLSGVQHGKLEPGREWNSRQLQAAAHRCPNHITIEDNTVYNEPGGGISIQREPTTCSRS